MTEAVEEECMALESIYGDKFQRVDAARLRVLVDPADDVPGPAHCLYLEVVLPDVYPDACPAFDLSNINNTFLTAALRAEIAAQLTQQANALLGESMIFTLAEWAREQLPGWLEACAVEDSTTQPESSNTTGGHSKQELQEDTSLRSLTKAQKRRHFDKFGAAADKPRGWNWVDIVSHLSKGPT